MMSASYFVVKSNPKWGNNLPESLAPGVTWTWITGSTNFGEWQKGDRIVLWEGSPANYVIGFAELIDPHLGYDSSGKREYGLRYLTRPLPPKITKSLLLADQRTKTASFLKRGNASGVVPLQEDEARTIFEFACRIAPEVNCIWSEFPSSIDPPEDMNKDTLRSMLLELLEEEDFQYAVAEAIHTHIEWEHNPSDFRPVIASILGEASLTLNLEDDENE